MRRWIRLGLLIALLQGCATRLDVRPAPVAEPGSPDTASATQVLQFRRSSLTLDSGRTLAAPRDLRPGDIILTTGSGLASAGIQLMTLAPVSHAAVYVGDGQVVEAVHSGVRVQGIEEFLARETTVLAFRDSELSAEQAAEIRAYALRQVGAPFNFMGVMLHVPLSIQRIACELPLTPSGARDICIRTIGNIQYLSAIRQQFFCSQLVLQAYRHAGAPITDADPRIASPADILHMREGDVASFRVHKRLTYVGLLKRTPPVTAASEY
jgi:cell wall-associated NlpC family hydrolase